MKVNEGASEMSFLGLARTLWHLAVFTAGRCAAQVKLCRVWVGPEGHFHKQRKPLAEWWVWPLNLALCLLRIRVEVMRESEWLRRERHVLGQVLGRQVVTVGSVLITPRLPGTCLWRYARECREDASSLLALEAAARALRHLHDAGVTHSDAALHNASYDPANGTVHWLDFETRYPARAELEWCQAHDLAAFLASATKAVPRAYLPGLVRVVSQGYSKPERLAQAGRLLEQLPVLLIVETPRSLACLDELRSLLDEA